MVTIKIDNVKCQLLNCPDNLFKKLRSKFKLEQDIYVWKTNPALRYKHLITPSGYFLTGLVNYIHKEIRALGFDVEIQDTRDWSGYDLSREAVSERLSDFPFALRPYQQQALETGLAKPRGVFEHATGAGKTMVMAALIAAVGVRTLIVTGKKDLAFQLQREISEYTGLPVGIIGGGKFDIQEITVGIVGSLTSKSSSRKKEIDEYLKTVRYLAIDECHHMQSKTWQMIGAKTINANFRHGFTATFMTSKIQRENMGKSQQERVILMTHTGQVVDKVSITDLTKSGYLATPEIFYYTFNQKTDRNDISGVPYVEEYNNKIANNDRRNALIGGLIKKEYDEDAYIIVFITRKEHGMALRDILLHDYHIRSEDVSYVDGDFHKVEREQIIEDFKNRRTRILIGTTIIGEGLNFFCNVGINACAGDSDVQAVQRLGRILRKDRTASGDVDPNDKQIVRYYDIFDIGHPWFIKQSKSRNNMYTNLGFETKELDVDFEVAYEEEYEPVKTYRSIDV